MIKIDSLVAGVRQSNDHTFDVKNPHTRKSIGKVAITSLAQIAAAVAVAAAKAEVTNPLPAYEIHATLMGVAQLIRQRRDYFVKTLVEETGFSLEDTKGEFSRGLDTLVTSAEEAKRLRGNTVPRMLIRRKIIGLHSRYGSRWK